MELYNKLQINYIQDFIQNNQCGLRKESDVDKMGDHKIIIVVGDGYIEVHFCNFGVWLNGCHEILGKEFWKKI